MVKKELLIFTFLIFEAFSGEVRVRNNCNHDVWVGNRGGNTGGFNLGRGQVRSIQIQNGRVWGQVGCNNNGGNCETGDNIISLAEMHWDNNGQTWYDISQVDGYNLPITMAPFRNSGGRCERVNCRYDLNRCPNENRVNNRGKLVTCKNLDRDRITNYSRSIKESCPNAYSWSKDDQAGMRDCRPGNSGLDVIFC